MSSVARSDASDGYVIRWSEEQEQFEIWQGDIFIYGSWREDWVNDKFDELVKGD